MLIFIFIITSIAIQKEEVYDYQVGLMITQENEDFIISQQEFAHPRFMDQKIIRNEDIVVLVKETNHKMDQIIDMKQNEFEESFQVWILYKMNNQSILSKQSIYDEQTEENYYLHLNYECYTFYFITKSQIIIDCQNQGSNILVLFDIKLKLQQSYYYTYYKEVSLRKLLQICLSDTFVLVQQEQLLILCRLSNKYQVCNKIHFHNQAHTVYSKLSEIYFISDSYMDVFEINFEHQYEIICLRNYNFSEVPLGLNFPILYYYDYNQYKNQFYIQSDQITICDTTCQIKFLKGQPLKIQILQEYLIIQTNITIVLLHMVDRKIYTIQHVFDNDYIVINSILQEFLILNKLNLKLFGISMKEFIRIKNQKQIIDCSNLKNTNISKIYKHDQIIFDQKFKFKTYNNIEYANNFVLVGGLLDIKFNVEDQYKDIIRVNHSYFKNTEYSNVQYFWIDHNEEQIIVVYQEKQTLYNKADTKSSYCDDFKNLSFVQSFNDVYVMNNISNGQQFIMRIYKQALDIVQVNRSNSSTLLKCSNQYCVSQSDKIIFIQQFSIQMLIHIILGKYEKYIYYDELNQLLYLINHNQLIIKYYYYYAQSGIHTQLINLCSNFINLVVLKYKLVLVCQEQMILYNKISNFRYVISGNVELYGQTFTQSSLVIQNDYNLFYIIDNDTMHVFNSNLPLTQSYVTKMKIEQFDDVKSQNQHICFQLQQNLTCYNYQINIKFNYDVDLVEYHQVFKVDVCGENKYNKKCKQYITRLDQQIRKISVKKPTQQIVINKNTKEIILDSKYFSGSIDYLHLDKYQLQQNLQFQDLIKINILGGKNYFYSYDGILFIMNNQTLLIYEIKTKQIKSLTTEKHMRNILKYGNNLLLISQNSISLLNCDVDCQEIIIFNQKISQQGFLHIHNNTLYTTHLTSLRKYNLVDIMNNQSNYIDEELNIYQLDMSQDNKGQMCMVFIDYDNKLVFSYQGQIYVYSFIDFLKEKGVYINSFVFNFVYSIQLLDNCQLVLICADFGSFFLELSTDIRQLAQFVFYDTFRFYLNQLAIGQKYLFHVQQFQDYIAIYKFTIDQIYNSKYLDLYTKLQKSYRYYDSRDYYFYVHADELYMIYQWNGEYIIYNINLDLIIQLEPNINESQDLLITLTNSDEMKTFILEIIIDESYWDLINWILVALLIILYIYLRYSKISEQI